MQSWFVSYVHEDFSWRNELERWGAEGLLGPVQITGEGRVDKRPFGEQAVRDYLRPILRGVTGLICLVGDDTHNHDWIRYEVAVAQSDRKPVIVVRIPQTRGRAPSLLGGIGITTFEPNAIRRAMERR